MPKGSYTHRHTSRQQAAERVVTAGRLGHGPDTHTHTHTLTHTHGRDVSNDVIIEMHLLIGSVIYPKNTLKTSNT